MAELISAISLAALAGFLFFPYNAFRVDKVRHLVFSLRDELFDEAQRGNIAFDSRAYVATRSLLNGIIRYSHRISFSRMIAFRFLLKQPPSHGVAGDGLLQAMNASSAKDRELCTGYILRADRLVMEYVLSSPLVLMFLVPQVIVLLLSKAGIDVAGKLLAVSRQAFAEFNKIAFREGQV